jgi:hypothetical protein
VPSLMHRETGRGKAYHICRSGRAQGYDSSGGCRGGQSKRSTHICALSSVHDCSSMCVALINRNDLGSFITKLRIPQKILVLSHYPWRATSIISRFLSQNSMT